MTRDTESRIDTTRRAVKSLDGYIRCANDHAYAEASGYRDDLESIVGREKARQLIDESYAIGRIR